MTRIGAEIRLLEGLAAEAWRGLVEQDLDGWRLRAAAGVTHRANSVLTLEHRGARSVAEKVAAAEAFSADHGIPSAFLLTDASAPAGLDHVLADAGYRLELPVDVLVAELDDLRGPHRETEHQVIPDEAWAAVWWPELGDERSTALEILRRPLPAVTHAAIREDGRIVAVGRGVAQDGWLGVYGMATTPSRQGRGLGREVLAALAEWGGEHGADSAYLQVTADNAPAQALYAHTGFRPHHRYWYRVKGHGAPFT
jgi:GNAT superfamily N-acetyltransferase